MNRTHGDAIPVCLQALDISSVGGVNLLADRSMNHLRTSTARLVGLPRTPWPACRPAWGPAGTAVLSMPR